MHPKLASVQGIVDLAPQELLDKAGAFLRQQGYTIMQRTDALLTAERRGNGTPGQATRHLSVVTTQQPEGGIRVEIRGNDREGVQEQQAAWVEWSESLPKRNPENHATWNALKPDASGEVTGPSGFPPTPPPSQPMPHPSQGTAAGQGIKLVLGGCVILPLLLVGLVGCLAVLGAVNGNQTAQTENAAEDETQNSPPSVNTDKSNAKEDSDEFTPADYDGPGTPSEEPIEVVLRLTGSKGGAFDGWWCTEEKCSSVDMLDSRFSTNPNFSGVLESEPTEYRFDMDDGVFVDATGQTQWDEIWVKIKKAERQGRDWEGEIYGELIVDGKVVNCRSVPPFKSFSLSWSPEKPEGGFSDKLNCRD